MKLRECFKYNYKKIGGNKKVQKNRFRDYIPMIISLIIFILGGVFKFKGVFILGLVVFFPISLFIQGVLCSKKRMGFIIPLVILSIIFFIMLMWVMGDYESVCLYLKYYVIAYILGYIIEKLISLLKSKFE